VVVAPGIRQDGGEEVAVHSSVAAARPEIAALCRRLGVRRLDLFGSATGPLFDERVSDVDVAVEFSSQARGNYFDVYFALKEASNSFSADPSTWSSRRASAIPTS